MDIGAWAKALWGALRAPHDHLVTDENLDSIQRDHEKVDRATWPELMLCPGPSNHDSSRPRDVSLYRILPKRILVQSTYGVSLFRSSATDKRVTVTPAVYPRLLEFLHIDIQSTGQKSHCVNTRESHRNALF